MANIISKKYQEKINILYFEPNKKKTTPIKWKKATNIQPILKSIWASLFYLAIKNQKLLTQIILDKFIKLEKVLNSGRILFVILIPPEIDIPQTISIFSSNVKI